MGDGRDSLGGLRLRAPTPEELAAVISDEPIPQPLALREPRPARADDARDALDDTLRSGEVEPLIIRLTSVDDQGADGIWMNAEVLASPSLARAPGEGERRFWALGGAQCRSQGLMHAGATVFVLATRAGAPDEAGVSTSGLRAAGDAMTPLSAVTPAGGDWEIAFRWGAESYDELRAVHMAASSTFESEAR